MAITSVGLVTIGQTPRPDLTTQLKSAIPAKVRVTQTGLLDGLSLKDVASRYSVCPGEMPLVTKMRDGRIVSISSGKAREELQHLIDNLETRGTQVIVLLCTGKFSGLHSSSALFIQPDMIMPAVLSALIPECRVGVILPKREQIGAEPDKWDAPGLTILYAAASPYDKNTATLEKAGHELTASGAHAIVLDCMGYSHHHKEALGRVVDVPVILSSAIIASVFAALF